MAQQVPRPVLPKTEILAKGPKDGLKEIRESFGSTLANIEIALPAPPAPAAAPPAMPKAEELAKGPKSVAKTIEEVLPTGAVKISEVLPEAPTLPAPPTLSSPTGPTGGKSEYKMVGEEEKGGKERIGYKMIE